MATLILLNKTELPKGTPSEALVAVWDKGSVPDGQISIPVELNERLLPIRDDLAAWTYETGCARINGKLLEEHLRADDNLSMWWCSTLVEKHPKVTHNLFPALKLRALELLLDEKGVTRLELCAAAGADPWMEDVLGRFCKATGREFAVHRIGSAEAAQPEGLKAKLKACYYRLPAPVKALVRFPAWLWIVRRRLPRTPRGNEGLRRLTDRANAPKQPLRGVFYVPKFRGCPVTAETALRARPRRQWGGGRRSCPGAARGAWNAPSCPRRR